MIISDIIYKADVAGNTRFWYYEVGEGNLEGYWRSHYGTLGGDTISTEWKAVEIKSQSSLMEQALFYADAEMKKKLKTDYRSSIDNIDETRNSFIRPMLAGKYVGWQRPCYVQPKLDGIRCLANQDGLWSRGNRQIISAPHIEGELKAFFEEYPHIILDGELYNHELRDNFNKIISLSRKTKPTFEDLEESAELIEYWVFDMFDLESQFIIFENRWRFLYDCLFNVDHNLNMVVSTPTDLVRSEEELDVHNIGILTQGYEGQMLRFNTPYEQKRTHNLLKRKEYVDEEFELLDILEGEGNWEGYAKIAVCQLPDGREFRAGINGDQYANAILLEDKDKYHSVTVKYQALTPDGIPRFPIAIKFHEEMFDGLEENIKPKRDLFS